MSYMMLHGLGDCTPELHCGCLGRFHVGQKVIYRPRPDAPPEEGFVTSMNERFVFVRYGNDVGGRATRPDDLEPIYRGAADECDCYPGGFSPETYEGPSRWCPMHGEVCEGALRCPGNPHRTGADQ